MEVWQYRKIKMDLKSLFKNNIPLIDVRAPVEFEAGHFPTSINLPIMNNEERHLVGIRYKESGQDAAIKLGHELVSGIVKEERVRHWLDFIKDHPNAQLYCFRGGLRSKTSLQWIKDAGIDIEIIPGGYKKLRRLMIDTIEEESKNRKFLVMAGRTGSGKTSLLKEFQSNFIDLEKHAHHKGSSFGLMGVQPAQISFENLIAIDFLKLKSHSLAFFESESIMIGSMIVPRSLFLKMSESPLVVLEQSMEERMKHIIHEYVYQSNHTYPFMLNALNRIKKKLGGLNYDLIKKQLTEAYQPERWKLPEAHHSWVQNLLIHYYDPFYDHSLKKNADRIIFKGNQNECLDYLRELVVKE